MNNSVERWQNEQGEKRRGENSADHHCRKRSLNLAAEPDIERHRNKAQTGNERGHEHRPQPLQSPFIDRLVQDLSPFAALANETEHYHTIEHGDAGEGDKSNARGYREWHVAQGERCHASRQCERDSREDDRGIPQGAEQHQQQTENHQQRDGHHNRQALTGRDKLFIRSAIFDPVAGWEVSAVRYAILQFGDK